MTSASNSKSACSAYKEWRTQHTYDVLTNNPWRPVEVSPDDDIAASLTHDPATTVVLVPGWGQNVARYRSGSPSRCLL
jgi:hypothetical protein